MISNDSEKEPLISLREHRRYAIEPNSNGNGEVTPLASSERITYSWSNINVFAPSSVAPKGGFLNSLLEGTRPPPCEGKQILKNVSGIARTGELLAIMGSSGAGKTTLMDVLTSRSSARLQVTGLLCANGVPVSSDELISKQAYVQQEDLFIGTLTVKEHLIFQALLRMDKHVTLNQRIERVNAVIVELGLSKCENTQIGDRFRIRGISGGEMKRLSFAAEVITNPSLMFCDEPTSGLDSHMAANIVNVLKKLARLGKTIVCTIHQPSSQLFSLFDKILLVSEGRVAFLGTRSDAESFFASIDLPCPPNYNPADHYVQSLAVAPGREQSCREAITMICDEFEKSDLGVQLAADTAATVDDASVTITRGRKTVPYKVSWCAQMHAVIWRSWITIFKNPSYVGLKIGQTILIAILVSLIYAGQTLTEEGVMSINGVMYIFLSNMTFENLFSAVLVFCTEMPLFIRDHRRGMYRSDVYFLSKNIVDLPLFILSPVLTIAICYYCIGLNPLPDKFFTTLGITILAINASVSFGYMISCLSEKVDVSISIAAVITMPAMLLSGYYINFGSMPKYLRWISYFSWIRYGYECLMTNQWTGIDHINCNGTSTCPENGQMVLDTYAFSADHTMANIGALLGLLFGFRILAYIFLLLKTYTVD
ncbi:protein white-like [Photinus pyralis]|uniref:protein white-like n=1 Tax=Photinus pyralis TaxID=7054 RepID=UPI0012671652|nr:protein white-like [Photinus pyralis]